MLNIQHLRVADRDIGMFLTRAIRFYRTIRIERNTGWTWIRPLFVGSVITAAKKLCSRSPIPIININEPVTLDGRIYPERGTGCCICEDASHEEMTKSGRIDEYPEKFFLVRPEA